MTSKDIQDQPKSIVVDGKDILLDPEGYLLQLSDWSEPVVHSLAELNEVQLNDFHWQVIRFLRGFYNEYETNPNMRVLIKQLKIALDASDIDSTSIDSILLMQHFGESPLKLACKLAGLPKPTNCL